MTIIRSTVSVNIDQTLLVLAVIVHELTTNYCNIVHEKENPSKTLVNMLEEPNVELIVTKYSLINCT